MAIAKNPGAGQGRGGGRPPGKSIKPPRQMEEVRLRLTPHVAVLLRTMAEDQGIPAWRVVESALLAGEGVRVSRTEGVNAISPPSSGLVKETLPPEAHKIAQECAAFLEAHEDRRAALKALRRAWKQAIALARHDLKGRTGEEPSVDSK